ncbi:patatin-like phospholipase family protein [Terrimonas pollutisoli]|uniref:patatin-like phospholipase family protein n=1 Tax=Terrimonas pollutisoli TaxID=3034147 RepID=UPI0023EC5BC9|nr:patatin-like phospholipase family protein [Terrimonas sp. H1YJ31]
MPFRILSLDGGGSRGVYSLGALNEVEKTLGSPLHNHFDLIFGTSTGAIIAALIALGIPVDEINKLYCELIPKIMRGSGRAERSNSLQEHCDNIFGEATFNDVKTGIGIVAMNYNDTKPLIFKADVKQTYSRQATFKPGFGCTISTAVQASSAAYPIFKMKEVVTENQGTILAVDGGFIANNPLFFAITDATGALKHSLDDLRVLSVGTGNFVEKRISRITALLKRLKFVELFDRTLKANSTTTEILIKFLYPTLKMVRINESFNQPQYGTNMVESDPKKLGTLFRLGRESYAKFEKQIKELF